VASFRERFMVLWVTHSLKVGTSVKSIHLKRAFRLINIIFDPVIVLSLGLGIICLSTSGARNGLVWLIVLLSLSIGFPLVVAIYLTRRNPLASLRWISQEKQLNPFLVLATLIGLLLSTLILVEKNGPFPLLGVYLGLILATFTTYGFRFYHNISGHSEAMTGVAVALVLTLGNTWWPVLLLIPIVGLARVWTNAHTIHEVLFGVVISTCAMLLGFWIVDILTK
jgi:hypothetical protein